MATKRLDRGTSLLAAAMLLLLGTSAEAQLVNGRWTLPANGGSGRRAVQPTPPPAQPTPFPSNPSFPNQPVHPVQFTLVPAILMSDGSIFANFGFGYEPVHRPCSGVVTVGETRVVGAGGVPLQNNNAPYTQQVPNQQTASQQMTSGSRQISSVAQQACFNRDRLGRVFVYRRHY